eukprot:TRINITY_DN56156_c0_g1_i1.p1 TRINITY_DN56156_c0_g1~~TRINITY_DN56156_c0_g1_i1.p1  ORF type:complete len:299 (-),score=28.46 TRINITY_DN56156_c0_g1_i1:51-947(-)
MEGSDSKPKKEGAVIEFHVSHGARIDETLTHPITVSSLVQQLRDLGVAAGMSLMVHSSLSKLGWVAGGPQAVIQALEDVLGPTGTLIMPTHTSHLSDPAMWQHPPVPKHWVQTIRDETPAFETDLTPTRGMGQIPETFRKQNGSLRSYHPQVSFAANGKNAEFITADHPLTPALGDKSPVGKLYTLGKERQEQAYVLLLGVNHDCNTSLHLAEALADWPSKKREHCAGPILNAEGKREWVEWEDWEFGEEDFIEIGAAFAKDPGGSVQAGKIGFADCLLMSQPALVDFAVKWMNENRK